MKKQLKFREGLVITCCLLFLSTIFYYYSNVSLQNVSAEVYSEVYDTIDIESTIITATDQENSYLQLPVWQDVYFQGVDERYTDPLLPATSLNTIEQMVSFPVDAGLKSVSISQDYAVFTQGSSVNSEVYLLNLQTAALQQLTHDSVEQGEPSVYGNLVVWQDYRNGNWDIYLYDLDQGKEYQLTNNPGDQTLPEIYQNSIVWQDNRNGNCDIYYCNLIEQVEYPLTSSQDYEVHPQIHGNTVTWECLQNGAWQIYVMNLQTGVSTQVSEAGGHNINPTLEHGVVLWTCYKDNQWSLRKYDLSTGHDHQVAGILSFPQVPVIYDHLCAYSHYQDGYTHTSLINLHDGSQLGFGQDIREYALFGENLIWIEADPDGTQQLSYGKLQYNN